MGGKRGIHGIVVLVAFGLVACGGDGPTPPLTDNGGGGGGGGGGGTTPVITNSVSVNDDNFTPRNAQTTAGSTVTWTWMGQNSHDVTFASGSSSATQTSGTFARQFPATGTFVYNCNQHPGMTGSIVVVP